MCECVCLSSLLLGQLFLKHGNPLLELFIFRLQVIDVGLVWRAKTLLDEVDGVGGLLGLLIETNQNLGQLVDDTGLLEELAELLLLLFCCLSAHLFKFLLYYFKQFIILIPN